MTMLNNPERVRFTPVERHNNGWHTGKISVAYYSPEERFYYDEEAGYKKWHGDTHVIFGSLGQYPSNGAVRFDWYDHTQFDWKAGKKLPFARPLLFMKKHNHKILGYNFTEARRALIALVLGETKGDNK